jgi:malonyl CoA-acyl carrier protein transacylase
MATAFLFPGQGSHTDDMRERVLAARPDLLALVEEIAGPDVFARAADSTRYAQPAIFCASLAGLERLREAGEQPQAMAGHSLGEVAALAAAGAIDEADALRLVTRRGAAMAAAGERRGRSGAMLAVLGGDLETIEREAARCTVSVANDNGPGQVVLSGTRSGLVMASDRLSALGARTLMLDVAGAFHSPFMADAVGPFSEALAETEIRRPRTPVWSSSRVRPFGDARDIRAQLAAALVRPVRWRETVLALHAAGTDRFVEPGPGTVLTRLVRRTLPREVELRV